MSFTGTISEAREIAQKEKMTQDSECWYGKYFVRYFSIYISYSFVKLGISANSATTLMGVAGLCGSLCMIAHNFWWNIAGAVLWQIWFILDCVDGEVARLEARSSTFGVYLDELTHIVVNSTFVLAFGLHIYFLEPSVVNLLATILIYSGWHWKREIGRITGSTMVVKCGLEKIAFVPERKHVTLLHVTLLSVGARGLLAFVRDLDVTLIITVAVFMTYELGVIFARWFLYIHIILIFGYVGALILRDYRRLCKRDEF